MCGGGSSDGGAEEARRREEERQARIKSGMASIDQTFSQFNDNFFNKQRDAYTAYAMPQLEDQYGNAMDTLTAALQRSGLLQSSVAAKKNADLVKQYRLQRQGVVDQGIATATNARKDIENARSGLVADLYNTADPAAAAAGAAARAKIATQQPTFSPLGILFQNVASGLADYNEARAYNRAFSGGPSFSYGTGSGSGRNVG